MALLTRTSPTDARLSDWGLYPIICRRQYHGMAASELNEKIMALERPHRSLWTYYLIRAVLTGPGIIAALPYLFFR